MAAIFRLAHGSPITSAGLLAPGAKIYVYLTGTSILASVWIDQALSISGANPIVADAAGVLPIRWLDNSLVYRVVVNTSADTLITSDDPATDPTLTQSQIGSILYPRTAAESAAGVTPTKYPVISDDLAAGVFIDREGALGDGTTDSTTPVTNSAAVAAVFGLIKSFGNRTYRVGDAVLTSINVDLGGATWKAKAGAVAVIKPDTSGLWRFSKIEHGQIDGNSRASHGLQFNQYGAGRLVVEDVEFINCDKAIYKPAGNIGNKFVDVNVNTSNYGYYAISQASPLMHAGNDTWRGGHFSGCDLAAVYINSPDSGTGQTIFDSTIIEGNAGFGVMVLNYNGAVNPLEFRNVWMEANHTAGTVTINAVVYTPKDWYLKNASQVKIFGATLASFYAESSDIIFEQCKDVVARDFVALNCKCQFYDCLLTSGMSFTGTSSAIAYSADIDSTIIPNVDIISAKTVRVGSLFASSRPMRPTNDQYVEGGTWVASYDGTTPYAALSWDFSGGHIFGTCVRGTATTGNNVQAYAFNVVSGHSYYIKCEMKLNSGAAFIQPFIKGTGSVIPTNFAALLVTGEWVTVHLFGTATNTGAVDIWCDAVGGSIDVSFGACTIVEATDFTQIQRFFNSGRHIRASKQDGPFATATPAGLATVSAYIGAFVYNSAVVAAGTPGWVCTTAGSPGTWKARAVVAA